MRKLTRFTDGDNVGVVVCYDVIDLARAITIAQQREVVGFNTLDDVVTFLILEGSLVLGLYCKKFTLPEAKDIVLKFIADNSV